MNYIVTTCLRPTPEVVARAESHAKAYGVRFIVRRKQSIETLKQRHDAGVVVFDKRRIEYTPFDGNDPFFFHPSSSVFRVKQLIRSGTDPLIEATALKAGDRVLDCTLGLGSDSIVLSHVVGPTGRAVGLESEFVTAMLVKEGLKVWEEKEPAVNEAMRRLEVVWTDALTFLKTCPDNSFDVVYFDPMFEKTISESVHLNPLRLIANTNPLSEKLMTEARRVAARRIVLKAHFESEAFETFGFKRIVRKTSKFHYGILDTETLLS